MSFPKLNHLTQRFKQHQNKNALLIAGAFILLILALVLFS